MAKRKLSKLQQAYRNFFANKMAEYEITSPSQLDDNGKIEFFNSIKKEWKKEKRSMSESKDINQAILDNLQINEDELSPRQQKFREFFNSKLDEFDVDSPADLDDKKKVEFFNSIDSDWKGLDEAEGCDSLEDYLSEDDEYNTMYGQTVMDSEDEAEKEDNDKIILFDENEDEDQELEEDAEEGSQEHEKDLEEEMTTGDVATYDTKLSEPEKKQIAEICKSKGFRLIEAKIIGKDKAKFIVERNNSNKRGIIFYDDNDRVFPFTTDDRKFSMLESSLDWVSSYTYQTDVNAAKHIKEDAYRRAEKMLEVDKYKSQTTNLSEEEQKRRSDRGAELIERFVIPVKEKKKTNRSIFGD